MEGKTQVITRRGMIYKVVSYANEKKTLAFLLGFTDKCENHLKHYMETNKLTARFRNIRATVLVREGDVWDEQKGIEEAISKLLNKLHNFIIKRINKSRKEVCKVLDGLTNNEAHEAYYCPGCNSRII